MLYVRHRIDLTDRDAIPGETSVSCANCVEEDSDTIDENVKGADAGVRNPPSVSPFIIAKQPCFASLSISSSHHLLFTTNARDCTIDSQTYRNFHVSASNDRHHFT
jgi:hypothetical protein